MVLYHLHTHAHRICVKKISRPRTYINTHNCSVLFHMYITFLKKFSNLMMATGVLGEEFIW